MAEPRRTFGPVVLVGVAGAALGAVAGTKAWVQVDDVTTGGSSGGPAYSSTLALEFGAGEMPLAGALALVLLACWGVLLVTRGRVRRAVAWLSLLTALGLAATVVTARFTLVDQLDAALLRMGQTAATHHWTGWAWAAAVGAVLSLLATAAAVRYAAAWPEMGSRYDAPTGRPGAAAGGAAGAAPGEPGDESEDLWRAIDEGRDPTDGATS